MQVQIFEQKVAKVTKNSGTSLGRGLLCAGLLTPHECATEGLLLRIVLSERERPRSHRLR